MKDYIIRKITSNKNKKYTYEYFDKKGNKPTDSIIKLCLSGIYISPALDNVKINTNKNDKVLAIGYDTKRRGQYVYNKTFVENQAITKFNHMIEFGESYQKINNRINKDLFNENDSKEKQIASVLRLVIDCCFRIGNEKYSKENKSYGVTTLESRHVKLNKDTVSIDFIGKKGVRNTCKVKNKKLTKNLRIKKKTQSKKDRLFTYRVNNKYFNVKSSDVNKYLKEFGNFSAKNFRTWIANLEFISQLRKNDKETLETKRKKIISDSLKKVAHKLHNTPSVCKSNYIDPYLIDIYTKKPDIFYSAFGRSKNKEEIAQNYLKLLKKIK